MSQEKTCMGRLLRAEKMKYRRSGTDMLWYLLPVLTLAVAFVLSTTYARSAPTTGGMWVCIRP